MLITHTIASSDAFTKLLDKSSFTTRVGSIGAGQKVSVRGQWNNTAMIINDTYQLVVMVWKQSEWTTKSKLIQMLRHVDSEECLQEIQNSPGENPIDMTWVRTQDSIYRRDSAGGSKAGNGGSVHALRPTRKSCDSSKNRIVGDRSS
jgi:hypothetical protein